MRVYIYSFAQILNLRGSPRNRVTDARNDRQASESWQPGCFALPYDPHSPPPPLPPTPTHSSSSCSYSSSSTSPSSCPSSFSFSFYASSSTYPPLLILLLFLSLSSFFPYSSSSLYTSTPPSLSVPRRRERFLHVLSLTVRESILT